jgi:hypothetical protein
MLTLVGTAIFDHNVFRLTSKSRTGEFSMPTEVTEIAATAPMLVSRLVRVSPPDKLAYSAFVFVGDTDERLSRSLTSPI